MARAAYRALSGALTLSAVQATVHPLNETDGSLNLASLAFTASVKRALANDVTVCGENEPVAYVTEYFLGDGVTTQFNLAADPYFPAARSPRSSASFSTSRKSIRRVWGSLRRDGLSYAGPRRPGDERRQWDRRADAAELARSSRDGRNAAAGSRGRDSFAGQHRNSGRFLYRTGDRSRLHGGISGDGAAGHRGGNAAAHRAGHARGHNLCGESSQPIYAARPRPLPGVRARAGDLLLLWR